MTPDLERTYRPARGFSCRRESFGGILYHYEGLRPDPRVTFVDSPFLVDLLGLLSAHPEVTPAALIRQATTHFQLSGGDAEGVVQFFRTLIQRGALEPGESAGIQSSSGESSHD